MIRGVLIDLAGVVHDGDALIDGAIGALERLAEHDLPYRFVTNTTSKPQAAIIRQLRVFGIDASPDHLFTPAKAAMAWLKANDHATHLLVHPDLIEDFASAPSSGPQAVIVGDARDGFNFQAMNAAFRLLIKGAPFIALAQNRLFLDGDGELSIDTGAFVKALEFASGVTPILMGKPDRHFFTAAANSMDCDLSEVAMIGDDAEADISGATAAGILQAILVRTGKYRPGDEAKFEHPPTVMLDHIGDAVDWIISNTQ